MSRRAALGGVAAFTGLVTMNSIFPAPSATAASGRGHEQGHGQATAMWVGRGIGDMTGENLGAGMNGYATLEQQSTGLHLRQRARAFIFADGPGGNADGLSGNGNDGGNGGGAGTRIVHVTCEIGLMFQSIQLEVLRRLRTEFGDLYNEGNLLLTATHTHAAPGGTSGHPMVDLTMLGFRPVTFEANVDGIVAAIRAAHHDLALSQVRVSRAKLTNSSVNRSRPSFDRNPEEDQAALPGGIDPRSQTLQVFREGELVGILNWFAVHPTSMTDDTVLASTDNKGVAALAWEREAAEQDYLSDEPLRLVTAFAQSNPGDMSPNLDLRPGEGPTTDPYANTRILGDRQYRAAADQVSAGASTSIGTGHGAAIDVRHLWVDMANVEVRPEFTGDGRTHRTALGALGAAFAAGSQEDGGGGDELPFEEAERGGNPAIAAIGDVIIPQQLRDAHGAKDILLPVGLVDNAIQQVFPFHLVRLGGHYIFGIGFEPTVASGLRIRRTLAAELDVDESHIIVQGYTNGYGHYITTPEEYAEQNYEGGSTAYGPWTLAAVQQIAADLARDMTARRPTDPGTPKRDLTGQIPISPLGNPGADLPHPGKAFGDVIDPPQPSYRLGQRASVRFAGTNPNSDLKRGSTYLTVEREQNGRWVRIHDDGDWSTMILFEHIVAVTKAYITWDIPHQTPPGRYRFTYSASGRHLDGSTFPVEGTSPAFDVR